MIYTDTKSLMRYLKQIKVGKDISNKELASKLNRTEAAISGLFSQSNITLDKLNDLCNALNCNIDITFIDKKSDSSNFT